MILPIARHYAYTQTTHIFGVDGLVSFKQIKGNVGVYNQIALCSVYRHIIAIGGESDTTFSAFMLQYRIVADTLNSSELDMSANLPYQSSTTINEIRSRSRVSIARHTSKTNVRVCRRKSVHQCLNLIYGIIDRRVVYPHSPTLVVCRRLCAVVVDEREKHAIGSMHNIVSLVSCSLRPSALVCNKGIT